MTLRDFQLARLAEFCFREVGPRGSLEEMKAIAICLKNRAAKGWHDGNLILVIEHAEDHAAHENTQQTKLNPDSRELQRLLREIEGSYYGDDVGQPVEGLTTVQSLTEQGHEKLYWCYIDGRVMRPWFKTTILADQQNHKSRTHMGNLLFLE